MAHPLVTQLRFTRREWLRGLSGVSAEEADRRFPPINAISWMVGHMAWHEQGTWLIRAQRQTLVPSLGDAVGHGHAASAPPLAEMWEAWHQVAAASDPYLDALTTDRLLDHLEMDGKRHPENIGTMLQRVIYHYWYHTGEAQAVRQLLGHTGLPDFVGAINDDEQYRSNTDPNTRAPQVLLPR